MLCCPERLSLVKKFEFRMGKKKYLLSPKA